jgi:hypothetical protein
MRFVIRIGKNKNRVSFRRNVFEKTYRRTRRGVCVWARNIITLPGTRRSDVARRRSLSRISLFFTCVLLREVHYARARIVEFFRLKGTAAASEKGYSSLYTHCKLHASRHYVRRIWGHTCESDVRHYFMPFPYLSLSPSRARALYLLRRASNNIVPVALLNLTQCLIC